MKPEAGSQTKVQEKKEESKEREFPSWDNAIHWWQSLEPGHSEVIKWIQATIEVGVLFKSHEGLYQSINTICWHLESYDNEMLSIINEWEACAKLLKQLEVTLEAELSTDKEERLFVKEQERVAKHVALWPSHKDEEDEEDKDKDEEKEEEKDSEEDELLDSSGLSIEAQGKGCAK